MTAAWGNGPLKSRVMNIRDEWIDYNGHLNMAYYNVLFDTAVDEVFERLGMGPEYAKTRGASFFTAEVHICYLRELSAGMPVIATLQLVDFDSKRAHFFQELRHAEEDWLSATSEQMSLHVDMSSRKVSPWPEDILANLSSLAGAQAALVRPERSGRSIGMPNKTN